MVAIVTGAGLGLDTSSAKVFAAVGQQGGELGDATFGRYGENVFVNAATGNLMIDRTDEILIGQGPDDVITRSYNSESLNEGYGAHNGWQIGDQRAIVGLSTNVPVNTAGSTVTRIDSDGSDTVYTYDNNPSDDGYRTYVSHQAGDAEYRLTYAGGTWTWSDVKNGLTETYDATNGGRLTGTSDNYGNTLAYGYTGNKLTTVTTADGEETELTWSGANLLQITVKDASGTFIESRTSYTYYPNGRLKTVSTDLSPTDGTLGSDKVVTTYGYDGMSDRVTSITQTGGAELDITYDGSGRVATLAQTSASGVTRNTSFTYGTGSTTISDGNGDTVLGYDTKDQLTSVTYPAAYTGAALETYSYTYDPDGNLATVTDPLNNLTTYTYDDNDNLTSAVDALGNTITYIYDTSPTETKNHLVTKTVSPGPGQPGPTATTRYAYNSQGSLIYSADADGEVTRYDYYTNGNLKHAITYTDETYDLTGLISTDTISVSQFTTWVASISDESANNRTDYMYDLRGNISTETTFSACLSNGNGDTTKPYTVVTYVSDQYGNLLTRNTSGMTNTEVFIYDGLGRMISSTDLNGTTTTMAWNDAANKYTVSLASTLVTVSIYDLAGELVTSSSSGDDYTGGTTTYKYDDMGRLSMIVGPAVGGTSVTSYFLYDNLGRKTADIATDGDITEYRYDSDNRLVATIGYATPLTSHHLSLLVDLDGNPTNEDVNTIRPSSTSADAWSWRVYDKDGRLTETIDDDGGVTTFAYDDMSNLISTTAYYNKLSSGTLSGFQTTPPTANVVPVANASYDETTRTYYDDEGRLVGTLDGDGYLSQIIYNHSGQKIETIAFSTKVASGHRSDPFSGLLTDVGTTSADIHTRYFYDDRGLLIYTLDANLHPTQYVYDSAGNLTTTIQYGASVTAAGSYPLSYVEMQTSALSSNPNNRTSWAVYDPATGNLDYSIDASGAVTGYHYDSMGNVIKETLYSVVRPTTSLPDDATMDTWAAANNSFANDRTTRMAYDAAGELVYTVDPEHHVTQNTYDAAGRIESQTSYAETYSMAGNITQSGMDSWITSANPANAVTTDYLYDSDGRQTDTIQDQGGLGIDTHTDYDALGRVTDVTVANGTSDASTTHYTYDTANRVLTATQAYGTADAATTSYTYDGMGNVLTVEDPDGNTTTYAYDALGQVLTKTDALSNVTSYTYDAFGNVLTTTDPLGGVVYSFYDVLNQLILQIDQGKFATATTYSIGGAITSVTHYATAVSGTITPGVLPTITTTPASDETTTFTLDSLDRVTQVTDAEGYYEQYVLDAFGDRTSVYAKSDDGTIKQGGLTTNVYDRRGLLTSETQYITAYKSDGTSEASTITNTYTYDARGNRTQMVEASGLTEQRTTNYTYDHLDRLTQTIGDALSAVDGTDLNSTSTVHPTTTNTYDNRGNLIETDDPTGARTLFYYDDLNRKVAVVDALGTLSTWTYDDNGNMLSARVYGDAVSLPLDPGGTAPDPVDSGNYRETTYAYDAINRLTTTTVADLLTGAYTSGTGYTTTTSDVTTTNVYDKLINALHQIDGNGNSTWTYYNKLGQVVAEVDQDNYLTTYMLNADGNVKMEMRFANASSITIGDTTTLTSVMASVTHDTTNDRVTTFTYDRNGNRLTETRKNVVYYTVSVGGVLSAMHTGNSTITYTYNGLGEVLSKAEATGDATQYVYDTGGRQTEVLLSTATNVDTTTVQERTDEYYDGLGDLVYTSAYDNLNGAPVEENTSYSYGAGGRLASTTDAEGFVRSYAYDAAGRVRIVSYNRLHSDGTTTTEADVTQYDLLGRTIAQGTATKSGGTWSANDEQETAYDAYGEVASRSINGVTQQTYDYDNGGRLWRTDDEGVYTITLYDKTGNQTLSVTSDGNDLTSTHHWNSFILDTAVQYLTGAGTSGTVSGTAQGMVMTFTTFDARGQATGSIQPQRQTAGNATDGYTTATVTTANAYDAFGEVTSQTDANGNATTFVYNTLGKITSQVLPLVAVANATGGTANAHPTQTNYYDVSGRLVGVQDANGNTPNTRALLANTGYDGSDALVTEEFHADTGRVKTIYDAFGNVTQMTNEVGAITNYAYYGTNLLKTQTDPLGAGGLRLTTTYTYDGLGQRLTVSNSQLGSGVKSTTDYDAEGRVTQTVDMDGHATTYAYVWNDSQGDHSVGSDGMEDDGGWTETTTNPSLLTDTVARDAEGRTLAETDYGEHHLDYTYDRAGRLATRTNDYSPQSALEGYTGIVSNPLLVSGETLTYSYFNTGRVAEQSSNFVDVEGFASRVPPDGDPPTPGTDEYEPDTLETFYTYDANGNETAEQELHIVTFNSPWVDSHTSTTMTENETASYDALNRMTEMDDDSYTGGGGITDGVTDPISVALTYDANGNIRERTSTYTLIESDDSLDPAGPTTEHDWYTYDSMNRFTITKGTLNATTHVIEEGSGTLITYDVAGERMTAQSVVGGVENLESYTYTKDGYLTEVKVSVAGATAVKRGLYTNDLMGRVTDEKEYDVNGTSVLYQRDATYDADSLVTWDKTITKRSDGTTLTAESTYNYYLDTNVDLVYGDAGDLWGGGSLISIDTHDTGAVTAHTATGYGYLWFSNAVEWGEYYDSDANTYSNPTINSGLDYDQRENLDSADIADGVPHTVGYQYNAQGEVTSRITSDTTGADAPRALYYYFGGIEMGDVSNDGTSNVDYVTAIADQRKIPQGGLFAYGGTSGTKYADFSQSYDAINGLTYGDAPQSYTVSSGDTLQSIAQAIWGDSSFWYLIADANGLTSASSLAVGETLSIPNKVTNNQNNSSTYNVYDPNEAIGNISPTHPPKPHNSSNCGGLGEILLAIVAVVVSVATYGALSGLTGTLLGTLEAGAVAGAAGSVVSQGVGLATGLQKSFNWGDVALSALGGAVGAGLGPTGINAFNGMGLGSFGVGALRGITSSLITQGVGVATGLQKSFDWAGVAAAGVGGGVINAVQANLGPSGNNMIKDVGTLRFVSGMAGDIAGAAAATLIAGTDFGDNLIKGLPQVIGSTIGGAIEDAVAGNPSQAAPAPPATLAGAASPSGSVNPAVPAAANSLAFTQAFADKVQTLADNGDTSAATGQTQADTAQAMADMAQSLADGVPPVVAVATQANADVAQARADAAQADADAKWALSTRLDNAAAAAQTVVDQGLSANVTTTISSNGVVLTSYTDGQTTLSLAQVGPVTVSGINGDAGLVAGELAKLPMSVLNTLAAGNVNFVAIQDSIADLRPDLYDVGARGRSDTWDTISAAYLPDMNTVAIATSGTYQEGAYDLVLHETGHAYDAVLGKATNAPDGLASNSAAFRSAYNGTVGTYNLAKEWDSYFTPNDNKDGYLSESFAESFADVYGGPPASIPSAFLNANTPILANATRQSLVNYWSNHP